MLSAWVFHWVLLFRINFAQLNVPFGLLIKILSIWVSIVMTFMGEGLLCTVFWQWYKSSGEVPAYSQFSRYGRLSAEPLSAHTGSTMLDHRSAILADLGVPLVLIGNLASATCSRAQTGSRRSRAYWIKGERRVSFSADVQTKTEGLPLYIHTNII